MKFKDLAYELANNICTKHLIKNYYSEDACESCPLHFKGEYVCCGKTMARLNEAYGDKEIDIKENEYIMNLRGENDE